MLAATLLFITIIKIAISANSEHGYFRADVDNAKAPLCARSDVFQFPNRTLHTGSWKIIGNDPLDSSTATSFLARDPQHGQCVVGPITQLHALECLRGRNIILIGDSITRNVFDPLVWWLERGERTEPKFSYPDIDKVPFVGDGGCGVGPLRCDACRSHNTTVPQVDNKHYSSRGVNVSLLGLYNFAGGRLPIHYTSGRGKGNNCKRQLDWKGDLRTLAGIIRKHAHQVDAILVNSGHWELPYFPYGPDAVNKSLEQLESLEGILPHGRKPIWMTTTKFLYGGGSDTPYTGNDSGYLAAKQLGWPILDRFGMTVTLFDYLTERHLAPNHTMYIDRLHFRNYVNREFVNMVTSMLCSVY